METMRVFSSSLKSSSPIPSLPWWRRWLFRSMRLRLACLNLSSDINFLGAWHHCETRRVAGLKTRKGCLVGMGARIESEPGFFQPNTLTLRFFGEGGQIAHGLELPEDFSIIVEAAMDKLKKRVNDVLTAWRQVE